MVFHEYMRSLPTPHNKIINEIAQQCKVTNITVYRWARGQVKPNALCRSLIAKVLNMDEGELFQSLLIEVYEDEHQQLLNEPLML